MDISEKSITKVSDIVADLLQSFNAGITNVTPDDIFALKRAYSILHPDHCPKCLSRFETHNADGSCPDDLAEEQAPAQGCGRKEPKSASFNYRKNERFYGRSGLRTATGIKVTLDYHTIMVEPITSKGETGSSNIGLPEIDTPKFIDALNRVRGLIATPEEIKAAEDEYFDGEGRIMINDNAVVSRDEEGYYIQAWIRVPAEKETQGKQATP